MLTSKYFQNLEASMSIFYQRMNEDNGFDELAEILNIILISFFT